ncbi:GDSL family lipase [Micromonospora globispora]|uniref:GDSL family lipase n=1 Tax=Micromonospora globispora TaxID=1450148 RepID=A0A317K2A1_9ACTN|nr:SGNH/GDSL hydrolase family protein [Micromonospora globispora]PWU46778.1 GDSL family lipase [Micromonospora globispora]RQW96035.1 GDSL family lipase [Micromonospora globispora]
MGDPASVAPIGWQRARQVARMAAIGTGATVAATVATGGVLLGQAHQARRTIPMAEAPPPRCDGVYGAKCPGPPITMVILGDSSAAGYGVHRRRETPGALLATGLSRRLQRPVRLHRFAVVGALSAGLKPQVESALECEPDIAVILVGGNDVTNRTPPAVAVRYLVDAVRSLRAAGCEVVVGTCPDLGAIQPIQPPLRWLARRWSRQLAAAQTVAVVEAGGWTVSLGDLLGPRFAAEPARMFAWDRFHPSAEGYAVAAAALLPTVLSALGAGQERRATLARGEGVRSLPEAAHEAARHAGTEVSGTQVRGRDRGPGGRWAQLRRRAFFGVGAVPQPGTAADPATLEELA